MASKAEQKWDAIEDNPLVIISELKRMAMEAKDKWIEEVEDFLDDGDVTMALNMAARMIAGEIPEPSKIAHVCAKLSALSVKLRMEYVAFMSYKKGTTDANMRKNHYKELYTGIDRLVDSLKYVAR
jgi:hypoxanthine-guanine phosphoribosyltransferase